MTISIESVHNYNPYFLNGVLGMPQQLFDEGVEFEDGTPATMSQQAKDVTTFLVWSSDIFHDTRKLWVLKLAVMTPVFALFIVYWKRHLGTFLHSRKNAFLQLKGRRPPKSTWLILIMNRFYIDCLRIYLVIVCWETGLDVRTRANSVIFRNALALLQRMLFRIFYVQSLFSLCLN